MTLHTKLLEIQKKLLKFGKDWTNPHFKSKYLTLDHLLDRLLPVCNELWLLIYHKTHDWNLETFVTYLDDKDWTERKISSSFPIGDTSNPQKVWSALTYWKRYNLWQLFNIVTDDDDDAQTASTPDKTDGKEPYKKSHIDALAKNMKNFPWTYTMTVEELIAEKEKNFFVSEAMKDSIKELYDRLPLSRFDRLPKKEIPEQVGTNVDEAFNK